MLEKKTQWEAASEERTSGMEDEVDEHQEQRMRLAKYYVQTSRRKIYMNNHDHHIEELWDTIKIPSL